MSLARLTIAALALVPFCLADLTVDQKLSDFNQLAGIYAKSYGPYELKRDIFGFDLYKIQPWLDQVKASKTDLEFYDICVKYVASLQDSHDEFTIPSSFDAWLHFDGDIYDGKYLIDYIDRTYLLRTKYPFAIGDELISVDGVAVADLLTQFAPYAVNGSSNPVSRARLAAGTITERYQGWYPLANNIATSAVIVVKRQTTGAEETYTIDWDVYGDAVTTAGLLPTPGIGGNAFHRGGKTRPHVVRSRVRGTETDRPNVASIFFAEDGPAVTPDPPQPAYMLPLQPLQNMAAAEGPIAYGTGSGLSPFGSPTPVFVGALPPGFKIRLGLLRTDQFVSGTFPVGTKIIGYIRIPSMSPTSQTTALAQFAAEMQFFQQNTSALVIDVMANGGGSICYTNTLASMLIPGTFQVTTEELRASLEWQYNFASATASAKSAGAPQWIIDDYQFFLDAVKAALKDNRARTGPMPLCGPSSESAPFYDAKGVLTLYTRPIAVLTDNFTLSAGELFTMLLQDNQRATVIGTTTDGGGGNVVEVNATAYSEGFTRITEGIIRRLNPVAVPPYPGMAYYDGVGIYPDVWLDYMTESNLQSGGVDFVSSVMTTLATMLQ